MQKKNLYEENKKDAWKNSKEHNEKVRKLLLNKGYNGMVYCNHGDKGSSMIAIHSDNIKVIEKTDF